MSSPPLPKIHDYKYPPMMKVLKSKSFYDAFLISHEHFPMFEIHFLLLLL